MASGAILNSVSENGYPPWSSGRSQKKEGCLLLDRHLTGHSNFIEAKCNRKRDFVCEECESLKQEENFTKYFWYTIFFSRINYQITKKRNKKYSSNNSINI